MPGVNVVIANPETRGQCADSHLGEIWVASSHNANGYFSIYGEESQSHQYHFEAKLETGDTRTTYARTGYLGFIRRTNLTQQDGGNLGVPVIRALIFLAYRSVAPFRLLWVSLPFMVIRSVFKNRKTLGSKTLKIAHHKVKIYTFVLI